MPDEQPKGKTVVFRRRVRALRHIDDALAAWKDGKAVGSYYKPGDEITGWDEEKIAKFVDAGLVVVEGVI